MKVNRWVMLGLVAPLVASGNARAAEPRTTARLSYRVPSGDTTCPDEQSFRDIVAGRLGYDPFESNAAMRIEATIEKAGSALTGRVRITNESGQAAGSRDVEGAEQDCAEVATSMAIAISIVLDPLGISAATVPPAQEPTKEQPAERSEASKPKSSKPTASVVTKPRVPPVAAVDIRFVAHAGIGMGLGLTPAWSLGPRVGAGIRADWFSARMEGNLDLMTSAATTDSKQRIRASLVTLGPTACAHFGPGVVCSGAQLGAFQAIGPDVEAPEEKAAFHMSIGLQGGIDLPLGSVLSLRALVGGRALLLPPSLLIDDKVVWEAPPIAGELSLALGAMFP